ncbi:MAG TPA: tetratricopeptide repeat protein [Streptosporangiaceae bacterium]|nr:tetratricopeptide repeat protein [Streptosporangiaceae bacterium]
MSEGPRGGKDSRLDKDPLAQARDEPADQGGGRGRGDRVAGDRVAGDGASAERAAAPAGPAPGGTDGPAPGGTDTYALYRRGLDLLGRGSAAAAAQLLERAAAAEPRSRSVLEALARAQFDAGRYTASAGSFRQIVAASPSDDYAQFGLGLALARAGDPRSAAEHLALAAAMRPDLRHYTDALRDVRATLRFRSRGDGQI